MFHLTLFWRTLPILSPLALVMSTASAVPPSAASSDEYRPQIAPASKEAELAIPGFIRPDWMEVSLFAAEPMLANPVAFNIDERGRFFVCETFRQQKGVEDNRNHMKWLHDDLAARSVEDRLRYFQKHLGEDVQKYAIEHDRIRLVTDTDRDGKADQSQVFADGFNEILTGTGAGVLAHHGKVWYTCIPDLWLLQDRDGDGQAEQRKSLHRGFGVRVAFRGHDMHGLTMGPSGRIYFSIGDRGFNVQTPEGTHLMRPDTGAVFRCEQDGSNLELFAYGLRNPQELAFDDYGNLFTVDNNSDSGDLARLVHVVEGGDSGWRMYFQYLKDRGPWNRERIWSPYQEDEETAVLQPASIVPPRANISDGPSGLAFYPGTGLPEKYTDHLFLCDFRGNSGNSGVRSFGIERQGASFGLTDSEQFIWQILATDLEFGFDGGLYLLDWVSSWDGVGKGRIYRFAHPELAKTADVSRLMSDGLADRKVDELIELLKHPDRRVRFAAQFELVERDEKEPVGRPLFSFIVQTPDQDEEAIKAQLHALWALAQLVRQGRRERDHGLLIVAGAPELEAASVRALGDTLRELERSGGTVRPQESPHLERVDQRLIEYLKRTDPRVQFEAAVALGKLQAKSGVAPLIDLLAKNQDRDPVLRHGAVMGLAGIGRWHPDSIRSYITDENRSVRLGVLLALRQLEDPQIARFLEDEDPALVLEAARAINDLPISEAIPELASLADREGLAEPLLRRVLNANFRLGGKEHAEAIRRIAAHDRTPTPLRVEALEELRQWTDPSPLDRVTNRWDPLPVKGRHAEEAIAVVEPVIDDLLNTPDSVREAAIDLAAEFRIEAVGPALLALAGNAERAPEVRVKAIQALEKLSDLRLERAVQAALVDEEPVVRSEGLRLLAKSDPDEAVQRISAVLAEGEVVEQQRGLELLAKLKSEAADAVLIAALDRLLEGRLAAEIQLDALEAASRRGDRPEMATRLERFEAERPGEDPLANYLEALAGGNAQRGMGIFFGRSEVSCRRCHKIETEGGIVGPNLTGIGGKKDRRYLLESIVLPNRTIAKGFETRILVMEDGKTHSGVVKLETADFIELLTPEGQLLRIDKSEVEEQAEGQSSMPTDLIKHLSKRDVRDLVEYLAALKTGHTELVPE